MANLALPSQLCTRGFSTNRGLELASADLVVVAYNSTVSPLRAALRRCAGDVGIVTNRDVGRSSQEASDGSCRVRDLSRDLSR